MAIALRFDRQTYAFAKPKYATSLVCTDLYYLLDEVIGEGHGYCSNNYQGYIESFNDLSFYMDLCAKEECTNIEIGSINVFHNNDYC